MALIESLLALNATQFFVFFAAPLLLTFLLRRIVFHPLSAFPGPWLNAISPLPEVLAIIRGRQHAYHNELHQQYGPVVRVSPDELIFCGADAWDAIYGNKPGKPDMEKAPIQAGGLPPDIPARALTLAPWDDHARQRRAFAFPFSNTALLQQEPLVLKHVHKFIDSLGKQADAGEPVNMAAWLTYLTFDIVGELCFAEPFGCLENGEATTWCKSVINIANAGMFDQATRRIAGVGTWLQTTLARWVTPSVYREWRTAHFLKSREKTMRRLADPDRDHKDFIYYILRSNEAKSLISEMEIVMNTALFIGAGSDTTALMLTAWASLMLKHPEVYKKLTEEVRGALRSEEDITWSVVQKLEYLEAVCNETFRICAPVPTNLCRVVPKGGASIDGHWVAGGTTVSVSPWAATHSPLNFAEPQSFIPERWLDPDRFPRDKRHASQPFSYGPRGCIGKNLAQIEQRLLICYLLWNFDLQSPGGAEEAENMKWSQEDDMGQMKAFLVWVKPDLWVRLRRVGA